MSQHESSHSNPVDQSSGDGCADALATVAIIALVVAAIAYWLHGMPT